MADEQPGGTCPSCGGTGVITVQHGREWKVDQACPSCTEVGR